MQEELNRARSLLRSSESVESVIQLLDQTFERLQSDVASADLTDTHANNLTNFATDLTNVATDSTSIGANLSNVATKSNNVRASMSSKTSMSSSSHFTEEQVTTT